ncbi:MAG: head GIN domain-containing protein [Bacteroidota bacterium]
MKKLFYLSFAFILTATVGFGQSKDVRQVDFFNAIHSSGSWDVFIKKGSSEKVVIEAESGPIEKIETEVEDNTLKIRIENGSWSDAFRGSFTNNFKNVKIYVTFTELGEITGSGSGTIRLESPINSEDVMIRSSGSGNFYAESSIKANDDMRIVNSGSSTIKFLASVTAGDETEITNSGSGDIEFDSFYADELEINNSGSGNIEIEGGEINSQSIRLSGSGNMKMEDLKSKECEIRKSGSGNVYVSVTEILRGSSSGSGNVYVKNGRPRLDLNFSGSGKVKYL